MAIQRFDVTAPGGNTFRIYAEPANINFFLKTPLTPAAHGGVTNKQVIVGGAPRRQYPGDPTPIAVAGSNREVLVDPTRKSGTALPGYSVVLVGDPGMPGEERRQFTVHGRFIDLHAWLSLNAKMETFLISPRGARYTIAAAGTQTP